MMRILYRVTVIALATALYFEWTVTAIAQQTVVIQEGQIFNLAVIPVQGEIYIWEVYTGYTLDTVADPPDVIFIAGKTGASVPVEWGKPGTYYYTVNAFSPAGCMNLKVGMISVEELKELPSITIYADRNPICPYQTVKFSTHVVQPGTNPLYQWFKNDLKVGSNAAFYIDDSLQDMDVVRCELTNTTMKYGPITAVSNSITIRVETVIASFSISGNGGNVPGRIRLNNHSIGAEFYFWNFGNGHISQEKDPEVTFTEDGTYRISLQAVNYLNCKDTCSYPYTVLFKGLYIPNAFAPEVTNGRGGRFLPAGINLKRYRIEVYDNWGHLIWESSALDEMGRPAEGWDGKFNGNPMPQGIYMWKVQAIFIDGTEWEGAGLGNVPGNAFGTVTLLR